MAGFAQQLPPGTFADYVSAGERGAPGRGGARQPPAPGLPTMQPLSARSGSFRLNGARAS